MIILILLPVLLLLLITGNKKTAGFLKNAENKLKNFRLTDTAVSGYTFVLCLLNFIRCFDHDFWADEAWTIRLARMSIPEMIQETALDVHPPLYYLIVMFFRLFGDNGFIYHFASFVPYLIILVVALTYVRKKYGTIAALTVITFSSLLTSSMTYSVEVRMYSWAECFLFIVFLSMHGILENNEWKTYACFTLFSILAAYTHYYCLIGVSVLFLILIFMSFFRRKMRMPVFVSSAAAIGSYLPWLTVLLKSFERTSSDYWMTEIPSVKASLLYLFSSKIKHLLFGMFLLAIMLYLLEKFFKFEKENSKLTIYFLKEDHKTDMTWIFSGFLCVLGTIAFGILISRLLRPMYDLRYIFPVSIIIWMIFGYLIENLPIKRTFALCMISAMLIGGIPRWYLMYRDEADMNKRLNLTLKETESVQPADVIIDDMWILEWTVIDLYYPGIPHRMISDNHTGNLKEGTNYWFMLTSPMNEELEAGINSHGFEIEKIIDKGNLGTRNVWIYKAVHE